MARRSVPKSSIATFIIPLIVAGAVLLVALFAASRKTEIRSRATYDPTTQCKSLCNGLPSSERGSCLLKCPKIYTGDYECTDVCLSNNLSTETVDTCFNSCKVDIESVPAVAACREICRGLSPNSEGACRVTCQRARSGTQSCTDVCNAYGLSQQKECNNKCPQILVSSQPTLSTNWPIYQCDQFAEECEDIKYSRANTATKEQLLKQVLKQMDEAGCQNTATCSLR